MSARCLAAQLVIRVGSDGTLEVRVDGTTVHVDPGATVLDACDAAGRYVPRLCYHPGLGSMDEVSVDGFGRDGISPTQCGLCLVRLGDGCMVLACRTAATTGTEVTTDDAELRALRLERLAGILDRHPHICLSCPDREGCARDDCSFGNPPEARCCDEFGRCEFGAVVAWVDKTLALPRRAVATVRDAVVEGRIRCEPGLCIACGRCVRVCEHSPDAGRALWLVPADDGGDDVGPVDGVGHRAPATLPRAVALPKQGTLRASGCTFCGRCVLVCPTGALTAPGEAGARWLAERRERHGIAVPHLPPGEVQRLDVEHVATVPHSGGVYRLFGRRGEALRISGVDDLQRGLTETLADPTCAEAVSFDVDLDPLFTQRESELLAQYVKNEGHLPPGNDLGDELFDDDL